MINVEADVVFGTGGGRELRVDIYRPDDLPPETTALIMWHGGGWRRGDRTVLGELARLIAAEGFLRGVRAPVETHVLQEVPHGFANYPSLRPLVAAETANFLRRTLVDPALVTRDADARAAATAASA